MAQKIPYPLLVWEKAANVTATVNDEIGQLRNEDDPLVREEAEPEGKGNSSI